MSDLNLNSLLEDLLIKKQQLIKLSSFEQKTVAILQLQNKLLDPSIWQDQSQLKELNKQKSQLEFSISSITKFIKDLDEQKELFELAKEENCQESLELITKELQYLAQLAQQLEFECMFNGEFDHSNTFVDLQAGSGGTEAQDWAEMLLRMYLRWAESRGFKAEITEISSGEVAGIKSATVKIDGSYAYGWLRTETGIHRLVRKSPFDSGNRRHTSFASVFVYPEIDEDINIQINQADLRIDTYRAGGAGGQHVNRTDSAVRITHMPTGIVVQCQSDRSQHKNKSQAMKQLKARLYDLKLQEKNQEKQKLEENKSDIGWGNQIRSYVLDQSRIKDLRTGLEIFSPQKVLDGEIDPFLNAALTQQSKDT